MSKLVGHMSYIDIEMFIFGGYNATICIYVYHAGGHPPRGRGGAPAEGPGGATAAAAVGPAGGRGEAPKDYTKPQQIIQSPDRQYKAPADNTKPRQTIQSPQDTKQSPRKTIQRHNILDKDPKY